MPDVVLKTPYWSPFVSRQNIAERTSTNPCTVPKLLEMYSDDQSYDENMHGSTHMNSVNGRRSRNQTTDTMPSSSLSNALADPGTNRDTCWLKFALTSSRISGSGNLWPPYSNSRDITMDQSGYQQPNIPSTSSSVTSQQYYRQNMDAMGSQFAPSISSRHSNTGPSVGQPQWMPGAPNQGMLRCILFLRSELKLSQALLVGLQLPRSSTYPT